jgi:hypothetical protein
LQTSAAIGNSEMAVVPAARNNHAKNMFAARLSTLDQPMIAAGFCRFLQID